MCCRKTTATFQGLKRSAFEPPKNITYQWNRWEIYLCFHDSSKVWRGVLASHQRGRKDRGGTGGPHKEESSSGFVFHLRLWEFTAFSEIWFLNKLRAGECLWRDNWRPLQRHREARGKGKSVQQCWGGGDQISWTQKHSQLHPSYFALLLMLLLWLS